VVIAIISILAGLLLPALENALESARKISCLSQQRQLYLNAVNYANDFDDRLAISGYYVGGDGNGTTGLSHTSMRYFVMHYLEVPLYNLEYYYGPGWGVQQTDPEKATCFWKGEERGILQCPSSILYSDMEGKMEWIRRFDYEFNGFSVKYYLYPDIQSWSRLSKMGTPMKGERKVMFRDHLYVDIVTGHRDWMYLYGTGHKAQDPQGQNYVTGDGSGGWAEWDPSQDTGANKSVFPKGVRTIINHCYPSDRTIATASGKVEYYKQGDKPVEYQEVVNAFF
jgi:hypothetical protein